MSITAREELRSKHMKDANVTAAQTDMDGGAGEVIKLDQKAHPLIKGKIVGGARQRVFEGRSESTALMIASLMQQ